MEQDFGLVTRFLFGASIDQRTLAVATDVFLNHFLFLLFVLHVVALAFTIHYSVHRGELAIVDRRLTLIIPKSAKSISSLTLPDIVSTSLEIVTGSELLVIPSVLLDEILDLVVLRIECVHQAASLVVVVVVVVGNKLVVAVVIVERCVTSLDGSPSGRVSLFLLLVVYKVVVGEPQSGSLEVTLFSIGVHHSVHLICVVALRAISRAVVQKLGLLVWILISDSLSVGTRLLTTVANLKVRLLFALRNVPLFLV